MSGSWNDIRTYEADDLIRILQDTWGRYRLYNDVELPHDIDVYNMSIYEKGSGGAVDMIAWMTKDLNETHCLIPNRALWKAGTTPPTVPKLPLRGLPPIFNFQTVDAIECNHGSRLEHVVVPTERYRLKYVKNPIVSTDCIVKNIDNDVERLVWSNKRLHKWVIGDMDNGGGVCERGVSESGIARDTSAAGIAATTIITTATTSTPTPPARMTVATSSTPRVASRATMKRYSFYNCLFVDCIFRDLAWSGGITFTACRFTGCTWINCLDRGCDVRSNLNCEFENCVIINNHKSETFKDNGLTRTYLHAEDMKRLLIGIQSRHHQKRFSAENEFTLIEL